MLCYGGILKVERSIIRLYNSYVSIVEVKKGCMINKDGLQGS